MEPHPVPQNILDVEFKLFGSFTLKQFAKMLLGFGVGVGIFFAPLIPELIKYPMVLVSIALGIFTAVIPSFGTWVNGFLRALFIAPRYVWIRQDAKSDVLTPKNATNQTTTAANAKKNKVSKTKTGYDIGDMSLDKLLSSDDQENAEDEGLLQEDFQNTVESTNFERTYNQAFAYSKPEIKEKESKPLPKQEIEDYEQEIKKLKFQLSMLVKDGDYQAKEQEILSKINDLYLQLKLSKSDAVAAVGSSTVNGKSVGIEQTAKRGNIVFGIIVDKKDNAISNVEISLLNIETNTDYITHSSSDGRFTTGVEIPAGNYNVTLKSPNKNFHSYKIVVGNQKLPAYKFREK